MRIVVDLPEPFGPEEAVHLAGLDPQVQTVECHRGAEALAQAGDLDRSAHASSLPPPGKLS